MCHLKRKISCLWKRIYYLFHTTCMAFILHVRSNGVNIFKKWGNQNIYPVSNISPTLICFKIFSITLPRMLISQRNFLYLKGLNIMNTSIMLFPLKTPKTISTMDLRVLMLKLQPVCEQNVGAQYVLQVNSYRKVVPFIFFYWTITI